ncbi:MAG: hypothetical protein J6X02_03945 [Bacilli bacterium]|nr:hypothetical protein [Bacilli bacterium]
MINDYESEFNVSKEVIDSLPRNNIKNRTKCIAEIDNLLKKYLGDKDLLLEEIRRRYKEYSVTEINPEIPLLNERVRDMYKILPIFNEVLESYVQSGLDRIFYNLDHFYKSSLEEANKNIFACINIFEQVGIKLQPTDFVYSIYTLNYISEVFAERQNGIDSAKLKTLFDSLYWRCPDIIKQITINFKYLYYKYKKEFDAYYVNQRELMSKNLNKSGAEVLKEYKSLKSTQDVLIYEDKALIQSRFLNGILEFKNYTSENIAKNYRLILNENVTENAEVNENILKLYKSLKEYKSYLSYKYIVDDIKNLFKEKDKYQKIAAPKKKEIEKLEGKLISNSKNLNKMIASNKSPGKIEGLTNQVNIMISQVEALYKEYEENLFLEKIKDLSETTSIYEALSLAVSNYRYIKRLIKNSDETLDNDAINRIIDDINYYLYTSELSIINNIYITDERNIAMVIFDKYNLLGFNIQPDLLEPENIDGLIEVVAVLVNNIYFDKVNVSIDNLNFIYEAVDIIEKKE